MNQSKLKATSNVTSSQVVKTICGFISQITDNPVIISQINRVPDVVQDHVVVTLLREEPLGYVIEKMNKDGTATYTTNSNLTVQIDCYSVSDSATTARNIARMVKTNFACDYFKNNGFEIQPISATNVRNLAFINDAEQYEQRHMFEMTVNYNPAVTFEQDYFTNIDLKVAVPVDLLKTKNQQQDNTNTKYFWDYYDLTHIDSEDDN